MRLAILMAMLLLPSSAAAHISVICGTADDTATIQAAINMGGFVQLPAGTCRVSSLNITGIRGVTLQGMGRESTVIEPLLNGANVLDLSGSGGIRLAHFRIGGYGTAVTPTTGILLAQTVAYGSDAITIDHVRVDGFYGLSALYNLSVASSLVIGGQFYNYTPGGITVIFTGNNFFGATSAWQTITNAGNVPSDWTFIQTEFHNFANNWALWLGGTRSMRWYGGNMSSGHIPVSVNSVMIGSQQADPGQIIFDGTTFYGDEVTGQVPACAVSGSTGAVTFRANQAPMPLTGC